MAYNVYYACDRCGLTYGWINYSVCYSDAVAIAREKGWQVGKKGWFCPDCKQAIRKRAGHG